MYLALSGSGVNFTAHLGAIKAIEECYGNDKVERIACVSGGSIIGGLYALGYSVNEILDLSLNFNFNKIRISKFSIFNLLFKGFLYDDSYLNRTLYFFFGDNKLCHTNIRLSIIASAIRSGDFVIMSSILTPELRIYDAVRASIAAPFVFKEHMGLYDGGLTNNIPIDIFGSDIKHKDIMGIKIISDNDNVKSTKRTGIKLIDLSIYVFNTLFNSLDKEHMEENLDKIIFIRCPASSFDFSVDKDVMLFNYALGFCKTYYKLKGDEVRNQPLFQLMKEQYQIISKKGFSYKSGNLPSVFYL